MHIYHIGPLLSLITAFSLDRTVCIVTGVRQLSVPYSCENRTHSGEWPLRKHRTLNDETHDPRPGRLRCSVALDRIQPAETFYY